MIRWVQNWLTESVLQTSDESSEESSESQVSEKAVVAKTIKERGMKRFVAQILSVPGKVTLKAQKVCRIVFNPSFPLINRIIIAFRALLKPYGITVSLDEI